MNQYEEEMCQELLDLATEEAPTISLGECSWLLVMFYRAIGLSEQQIKLVIAADREVCPACKETCRRCYCWNDE